MAKEIEDLYAFNRGLVSRLAAARVDVKRVALSAEEQTNFIPRVLGSMALRPGLGYLFGSYATTRHIPFVFAVDDTAGIELSAGQMRIMVGDALLSRPALTHATLYDVTDAANWVDADEVGGVSTIGATMILTGNNTAAAIRTQSVAVTQAGVHAVVLTVSEGVVDFRVGTAAGLDDLVVETQLGKGTHNIAFTAGVATVYLRISNRSTYPAVVTAAAWAAAGIVTLPTPWTTTQHLTDIRYDQSGDVVFVAAYGVRQMRIERRPNSSWSIVDCTTNDGPFRLPNASTTTLSSNVLYGTTVLTASRALFKATHVGALFRLTSTGQNVAAILTASDTYTDPVRVTGVGADRTITHTISGTWVGTLTLQRSIGVLGLWTDVGSVTNGTVAFNDTFDNQIIYYRIGFKAAAYTSGAATVTISYPIGAITGALRVTQYVSDTVVFASITIPLGSTAATLDWAEGEWSVYRGFPSAVALHGGRLWWAGKDKQWGSISDAYSSFDDTVEGDAGPISRTIGTGPVDKIRWLLSAENLMMGGQGAEFTVRASQLDEPLTPTNYNLKSFTRRGSGSLAGVVVDANVLFVDRSESRVFELESDQFGKSSANDVTAIVPELCRATVIRMAVQRLPDTRIHAVLGDGTVALLVYDKQEEVRCWVKIETDGLIKDVLVLPTATGEDAVYYVVQRTVGGATVNFLEKWAKESEAVGGAVNKMADAFTIYSGAAATVIPGVSHLAGRTVVCWADGIDRGVFTVSAGGTITLPVAVTKAVVGLTYRGRFKSTRLGYNIQGSVSLANQHKQRVTHVALLLADTHAQGLTYGTEFDYLDDLPLYEESALVGADTVHDIYVGEPVELNGTISNSTQLCLEANAPRPCTVLGAIITSE